MNRRTKLLVAPFLLTVAFSPAHADQSPPTRNPPPPQRRKLPAASKDDQVTRRPDGTCWVYQPSPHCPPNINCNPPAPREVECPPPENKK